MLSQFQNIGEESEKYADEWLNKAGQYFDPDRHDSGDFEEQAYFESIEFYQMLEDMLNRTRLSIVAGIFHEWEKQLKTWIVQESRHWPWHCGDETKKAIWKANFGDVTALFESIGWLIRDKSYCNSLNKCRLVVNAYKHGSGSALEEIKADYPEFLPCFYYVDHTHLKVDETHITEFSDSIIAFWNDVPEYIWPQDNLNIPNWLKKALTKDELL